MSYLPTGNSVSGVWLQNLICTSVIWIISCRYDFVLCCGDYNGLVCDIFDTINNIDVDEPPWYVIGHVKCGHADALLEFVKDGKLAVLNEIIDPKNVNFTFASSRGKSVIDYIINLHDYLQAIDLFNVDLVSDPIWCVAFSCVQLWTTWPFSVNCCRKL